MDAFDVQRYIDICDDFVPDYSAVIPNSVDWRKENYVTPVKDQGECDSCYTFSATGALEGQIARKTGTLPVLSEQNLLDCAKGADGTSGCKTGGLEWESFIYVKENGGIESEATYPYTGKDGTCSYNPANAVGNDTGCVSVESNNEEALKIAVATQGPISASVFIDFDNWDKFEGPNVFDDAECDVTPPPEPDHAILIVGYGTDDNGIDYWLIKNSYGVKWGDQGYIKLIRGKNCLNIASAPSFPRV